MQVYSPFQYAAQLTHFPHQTQRKLGNNMLLGVGPSPGLKGLNTGWEVLLSPPSFPSIVFPLTRDFLGLA